MTFNLTRFNVSGDATPDELLFCLQSNKFIDIVDKSDERSVGFTNFFDLTDTGFNSIEDIKIEHFIIFGMRFDTRKIPSAMFKIEVAKEKSRWLQDREGLSYVPKSIKEQISDEVRQRMLRNTTPAPSFVRISWNLESHELLVWSRSQKTVDTATALFHQAFPMLRLSRQVPILRYGQANPGYMALNQASTDSVLELAEANRGLWHDFFSWLLYRTLESDSRYHPKGQGQFTAYVDNKFVLSGLGHEGFKKIRLTGNQDQYSEVKMALAGGFVFDEVGLVIVFNEDEIVELSLDVDFLQLAGAKIPIINADYDPSGDPLVDRIAEFLITMAAIQKVQSTVDALVLEFLSVRSDKNLWSNYLQGTKEAA